MSFDYSAIQKFRCLYHVIIACIYLALYKKDCDLLVIKPDQILGSDQKQYKTEMDYLGSTYYRICMGISMVNAMMMGAYVFIASQNPRSIQVIYKCQFVQSQLTFILLLLVLIFQVLLMAGLKQSSKTMSEFDFEPILLVSRFIFVETLLSLGLQVQFVCMYVNKFQRKGQYQENTTPGFLGRHPPDMTYQQYDNEHYQAKVTLFFQKQKEFQLSEIMLVQNLQSKSDIDKNTDPRILEFLKVENSEQESSEKITQIRFQDIESSSKKILPEISQAQADLVALKHKQYQELLMNYNEINELTCSICMENMVYNEFIVKTQCVEDDPFDPLKGHKFHKHCLHSWLAKGYSNSGSKYHECPLCRQDIFKHKKKELYRVENIGESFVEPQRANASEIFGRRSSVLYLNGDRPSVEMD